MRHLHSGASRLSHLIERIVLTSFIEGLSDSTLRWELRKSKPATADDALALAMELNSFLEIERGAPSSSHTTAGASVNMISREHPEQSNHQIMENLVRTLTEGIRKALPKPEQKNNRQRSATPNRESTSRSNSIDSQRGRAVRFEDKKSNNYHNNQNHKRHTRNGAGNRSNGRNVITRAPCKHCKRTNHDSKDCKACFKCGRVGHFQCDCRSQSSEILN